MGDYGMFLGFGSPIRGREVQATKVFGEAMAYYAALQQRGEIDGFDAVILEAHGGDLGGFILIRGDAEKLGRLRMSPEFQRLVLRAQTVVDHLGVVSALMGAEAARFVAEANGLTADLRTGG